MSLLRCRCLYACDVPLKLLTCCSLAPCCVSCCVSNIALLLLRFVKERGATAKVVKTTGSLNAGQR